MQYLTEIKFKQRKVVFFLTATMTALLTHSPAVHADICSEGTGIPPFLSSSVDPNMLLIIDNSGSMLDMAYIDNGDPAVATDHGNTCFDDTYLQDSDGTFDETIPYSGYFDKDTWYQWTEDIDPATANNQLWPRWAASTVYNKNDIIFDNGVFYRAYCGDPATASCTSGNVDNISKDENVTWIALGGADSWKNLQVYPDEHTGLSFVRYENQLYYTPGGGTSNSTDTSPSPLNDTGIKDWVAVEYTWLPGHSYDANDIVTYKGMVYKVPSTGSTFTSSSSGLLDDRSSDVLRWERMDEGYWQEVSAASPCTVEGVAPSYSHTYADSLGNSVTDLEITMLDSEGDKITDVTTQTSASVACFAARGNLLNWATSSKFDIQKEILTGGKYYAGYEAKDSDGVNNLITSDSDDDRLISESRGCAGSSYIKQITLDTATDIKLTLRVRGAGEDDWVDTTDNTTRLDILAVTVGGFDTSSCQQIVDMFMDGTINQGQLLTLTNECLTDPDGDVRASLNHAVQYCWSGDRDLTTIIGDCNSAYLTNDPSLIKEADDAYNCSGIFDANLVHDSRDGYIGRCYEVPIGAGGSSCDPYPQNVGDCGLNATTPCEFWEDGVLLGNFDGENYTQYCSDLAPDGTSCQNANEWDIYHTDSVTGDQCDPATYVGGASDWSNILYPANNPDDDPADDPDFATGIIPVSPGIHNPNQLPEDNARWWCIYQAMEDYCGNLDVPEVVDPSDMATVTEDFWNIPASLIDSGALTQLGVERPLAVYKGFIKYDLPINQDSSQEAIDDAAANNTVFEGDVTERPDGPRGIVFDVADSLRLGVMDFHNNGSKSEVALCEQTNTGTYNVCDDINFPAVYDPSYCTVCTNRDSNITKYNPAGNGDGAKVLVNVANGMYTDAMDIDDLTDDVEVWDHYVNIVTAINNSKATSWTPLAEAMYNALGYYGQDNNRRLQSGDFKTSGDYSAWVNDTDYFAGDIVGYDSEIYQTAADGRSNGTNPLDDANLTWSRVDIDPVQYWCQDNHILIITEGASTADINSDVRALAESSVADPDANESICTNGLEGSTYLDDLTYFGQNATVEGSADSSSNLYSKLIETGKSDPAYAKQSISTHIVTTGSLRTDGTGECSPYTLMTNAATNGGTSLYSGEDPSQLEASLIQALNDILNRASAGSAASVISSSRSGEGAAYQAVFWPKTTRIPRETGDYQPPLSWIGDVHSMYVDTQGGLWDDYSGGTTSTENSTGRKWTEDTNGNGRLDANEDLTGGTANCLDGDRRMFFYYDSTSTVKGTKICFNDSVLATPAAPVCDSSLTDYCGTFTEPVEIRKFDEYLWSANDTLAAIDDANITINRNVDPITGKWVFNTTFPKRYIFTWNDLNNDGIVDSNGLFGASVATENDEIIELDNAITNWATKDDTHHSILTDFRVDSAEMPYLVDWLRGDDSYWETDDNGDGILDLTEDINGNGIRDYVYRCRRFPDCDILTDASTEPDHAANPVWRLGDIIHSTPKLVAQPSEGFQTIYRDATYSTFIKKYRFRRHVIYFGANDGMLHAVNGGFFDEDTHQFYTNQEKSSGVLTRDNTTGPALGHELWAYIPYNLQPHLSCMTDPDYVHKYFVDHEPRIFDVQIWDEETACADIDDEECIHPGGWGTILVGSMRFGGSPVDASADSNWDSFDSNGDPIVDNREFVSSYFVMDITDPERPPTLLGEMTVTSEQTTFGAQNFNFTDLGYTTPMPTMVFMREADSLAPDTVMPESTWYLIMGKGPTTIKGENDEQGKLGILPLSRLTDKNGSNRSAFRLIDAPPSTPSGAYSGEAGDAGDTIAIPGGTSLAIPSAIPSFTGDLITVDMDIEQSINSKFGAMYKSDAVYFGTVDGTTFATPDPVNYPDHTEWPGNGNLWRLVTKDLFSGSNTVSTPDQWSLKKLITSLGPITAAPTVGWDGDNVWIYVGTGRFFANEDKTDNRNQYYYGIKEPRGIDCSMNWATVDWLNASGEPYSVTATGSGGSHGLLRTDNVKVIFRDFYGYSDSGDGVFFCDPYSSSHGKAEPGGSYSTCDMSGLTALDMTGESLTGTFYRYDDLIDYIAGETRTGISNCPDTDTTKGIDGWYRIFHDDRERNIGQATLLGGLLTFTTYQPSDNLCTPEGVSYLYGLHYQTGSAWYQNIFGLDTTSYDPTTVNERFDLGKGLSTTPSIHVGDTSDHDAKAFVQTSTGEIIEITQEDLPIKPPKSGKQGWNDSCQ